MICFWGVFDRTANTDLEGIENIDACAVSLYTADFLPHKDMIVTDNTGANTYILYFAISLRDDAI